MNRWTDRRTDGRPGGPADRRTNGLTDGGRMDGGTDGLMEMMVLRTYLLGNLKRCENLAKTIQKQSEIDSKRV